MKVAINGFGRIGKTFLRVMMQDPTILKKIQVVAINVGNASIDLIAHLFKYDTIMGMYAGDVYQSGNKLVIDGYTIELLSELDPLQLPWKQLGIDWVVDCTGKFTKKALAEKHIAAGANFVLITAPATNEDIAIIPGVNDDLFDSNTHRIVSLGSCTTNAFFPLLDVIHKEFGIERGTITTVHAYTNSQTLLDIPTKDPRSSRAAALNIIPSTTGALSMVAKLFPELQDKIMATSVRVPVGDVSLLDFSFVCQKKLSVESVHATLIQASKLRMRDIISITAEPLVSSDFKGNSCSVVVDSLLTQASGQLGKLFGWYDNEWGYSCRLRDFLLKDAL